MSGSKQWDNKDGRRQWGYRWSWNTSSTTGTRPFGTIRPSLVLSCKLNDSKTGAQWKVASSLEVHRIWFSTGCTSPSQLCHSLLSDWKWFAKSTVTTHQILFLHATFSHSKNICGSPNKILIHEAKELDHLLWWFAINIYIYKKVINSTSFNRIYLEIKIMFRV